MEEKGADDDYTPRRAKDTGGEGRGIALEYGCDVTSLAASDASSTRWAVVTETLFCRDFQADEVATSSLTLKNSRGRGSASSGFTVPRKSMPAFCEITPSMPSAFGRRSAKRLASSPNRDSR